MGRLSLAGRIVLVAAVIGGFAMAVRGATLLGNARSATRVEVDSNLRFARDYVVATVGSLPRDGSAADLLARLPRVLAQPRHVRIFVSAGEGEPGFAPVPLPEEEGEAPRWFRDLVAPPMKQVILPIRHGAEAFGEIIIRSDPNDEIDEVWRDVRSLAMLGAAAYVATLLALWLVTRLALRPLTRMAEGVARIEAGDYDGAIGEVGIPELADLAARVDGLGATLKRTIAEKDGLNRRLVSVGDEERKAIARELHDEFGPCLFGLKVEARSILAAASARDPRSVESGARSILGIVDLIQGTNRSLLKRLRPMELGELPLAQVLEGLAAGMGPLGPDVGWTIDIDPALDRYDETTELTLYRVAQEALTNALRHANAGRILFAVHRDPERPGWARLVITDDGEGIACPAVPGNGLRGMRERIASVAGRIAVTSASGGGTRVEAEVPLKEVKLPERVE